MTVELSAEEMELILLTLKERIQRRRADELPAVEETNLVARLEVIQRQSRGAPRPTA